MQKENIELQFSIQVDSKGDMYGVCLKKRNQTGRFVSKIYLFKKDGNVQEVGSDQKLIKEDEDVSDFHVLEDGRFIVKIDSRDSQELNSIGNYEYKILDFNNSKEETIYFHDVLDLSRLMIHNNQYCFPYRMDEEFCTINFYDLGEKLPSRMITMDFKIDEGETFYNKWLTYPMTKDELNNIYLYTRHGIFCGNFTSDSMNEVVPKASVYDELSKHKSILLGMKNDKDTFFVITESNSGINMYRIFINE